MVPSFSPTNVLTAFFLLPAQPSTETDASVGFEKILLTYLISFFLVALLITVLLYAWKTIELTELTISIKRARASSLNE